MSTSYRETFRRYRGLFCLPIVLGCLAAIFFLFGSGKTYKSTANIWVDTAATMPSSVADSASGPLAEPPAAAEQAILNELLTTRAFAAQVVKNSLLGKSPGSAPTDAQAEGLLWKNPVTATAVGGQVLQINYAASSPAVAESVLRAIVAQLPDFTNRLTARHAQEALAYDKQQVILAQAALAAARRDVSAYQAAHARVSQTDPQYVSLTTAEKNAVRLLAQANTAVTQTASTGNPGGWSLQVVDPPSQATTTPLRKSKIAEVVLAGALGGMLVTFLAVVALTPAKKEVWEDEFPAEGSFDQEFSAADPFGPGAPEYPLTTEEHRATEDEQPGMSFGRHRLIWTPSDLSDEE